LQDETHRGKGGLADQSVHKDGIRDSTQIRHLKDEEFFDRELWRERTCFGVEENCVFT
jgi:hypothetical protein